MKCPACHCPYTKVVDSRLSKEGDAIRRRRECEKCGERFTTHERVEEVFPLIIKKDGRREIYDRMKIVAGLKKACEKRPVSLKSVEAIADRIESMLQEHFCRRPRADDAIRRRCSPTARSRKAARWCKRHAYRSSASLKPRRRVRLTKIP